jgi:hypothetical protein
MPSPDRRAWGALLRSQGLGLCCGLGTVALLAVGSFALAFTRDGASAGIAMDDLRGFFARPSWIHSWLYLLVGLFGLYALNTTLATWHSVAGKLRAGVTAPARYAPALLHLSFLLALLAHAAGGLFGEEQGQSVVVRSDGWQPLPDRREARLLALEVDRLPNGMPKEVRADVELRAADGALERARVGYNQPISSGLGSQLHLLADTGQVTVARLALAGSSCAAPAGGSCRVGDVELHLLGSAEAGRAGPLPLAQVRVGRAGAAPATLLLTLGREVPLGDGRPLRLDGLEPRDAILLRSRSAPGNPWALGSALLLGLGVALLWRRFLPRAPAPAPEAE